VFNAITKQEIEKAFSQPQLIDMDKVNAQQARRILDRIVGTRSHRSSWKKVAGVKRRQGAVCSSKAAR
jgi:DNA topoisomerase-1